MRHPLSHPAFLVAAGLYGLLLALKKSGRYLPFISDYLADFLALPVVLSIALWAVRVTDARRRDYVFQTWHIAFAAVLYGLLFEGLFPLLSARHTADPWDLAAYALGGLAFAALLNHPPGKRPA